MTSASIDAAELRQSHPEEQQSAPRSLGEALLKFQQHGSPRILIGASLVALALRLWVGAWSFYDLLPLIGLILYWPIQEWLIHVFILHFKPVEILGVKIDPRLSRKHRWHHRNPSNTELIFIPLHTYLYSLASVCFLWFLITPTSALALTGITAHFLLALNYEWVHYLVHCRLPLKSHYYRRLWRNHMLHHFKNEKYWYGVSRLQGDTILRTNPDPEAVESSATCRTLGIAASGQYPHPASAE